jgi:hypothetical protein
MPAPPFIAPTKEPHTYTGICRCKATKFTIELPELTSAMKCNCSICSVHDVALLFVQDKNAVKFERKGPLIDYAWNTRKYIFHVCRGLALNPKDLLLTACLVLRYVQQSRNGVGERRRQRGHQCTESTMRRIASDLLRRGSFRTSTSGT